MPRLDFPGARHHVMNRGARKANVFVDDAARELFKSILAELPARFGVRVHAYALMPNHYHLLLESMTGNLPRAMRHTGGEFTRRMNRRHGWDGSLFRGRYHNRVVSEEAYWRYLLLYLHNNPERAGFDPTARSAWTSHDSYAGLAEAPDWLTTEELREAYGSTDVYVQALQAALDGSSDPPEAFDPERLWAPNSTGTVEQVELSAPVMELDAGLAHVCQALSMTSEEVFASPKGRRGNPANWVAMWWLSRRGGFSNGEIRRAFGCSHATVSQRLKRVEDRRGSDPVIDALLAKL